MHGTTQVQVAVHATHIGALTAHPVFGLGIAKRPRNVDVGDVVKVDCDACPERNGYHSCEDCVATFMFGEAMSDSIADGDAGVVAVVHDMCVQRALRLIRKEGLFEGVVACLDIAEAERRFPVMECSAV